MATEPTTPSVATPQEKPKPKPLTADLPPEQMPVLRTEAPHPWPTLDENRALAMETVAMLGSGPLSASEAVASVRDMESAERAVWAAYRGVVGDDAKAVGAERTYHIGGVGAVTVSRNNVEQTLDGFDEKAEAAVKAEEAIRNDRRLSEEGKKDELTRKAERDAEEMRDGLRGFAPALEIIAARREALEREWQKEQAAPRERSGTETLLEDLLAEQQLTNHITLAGASRNHEAAVALLDRYVAAGDLRPARLLLRRLAVASPDSLRVKAAALPIRHRAERLRQRQLLDNPRALKLAAELALLDKVEAGVRNAMGLLEKHGIKEAKLARSVLERLFEELV